MAAIGAKALSAEIAPTDKRHLLHICKTEKVQFNDNSMSAIVAEGRLRQINITTMQLMLIYDFNDSLLMYMQFL